MYVIPLKLKLEICFRLLLATTSWKSLQSRLYDAELVITSCVAVVLLPVKSGIKVVVSFVLGNPLPNWEIGIQLVLPSPAVFIFFSLVESGQSGIRWSFFFVYVTLVLFWCALRTEVRFVPLVFAVGSISDVSTGDEQKGEKSMCALNKEEARRVTTKGSHVGITRCQPADKGTIPDYLRPE